MAKQSKFVPEMTVSLVTVNFPSGFEVNFKDQRFTNYQDLETFVERFYKGWSSLVVHVVAIRS